MKKTLLFLGVVATSLSFAQVMSPDWQTVQNTNFPSTSTGIRYLDAVDANVVWATGYNGMAPSENHCLFTMTSDGGVTFTSDSVFADTNTYVISSIEGIDAMTAYITTYDKVGQNLGDVFKTTNGGATWTSVKAVSMFTNSASFANLTCFTDPMNGITMGDPINNDFEIYQTNDGAATWTMVPAANLPVPQSGEYGLVDVYTKLGNHIWFGTNKGRVYHSTDAGTTWTVGSMPLAAQGVSRLAFTDPLNGLGVGYKGTSTAPVYSLYKTVNGGNTWTAVTTTLNVGKSDLCAIPGTNMFASCGAGTGNYILSYTTDQGTTWTDWGSTGIQYLKIDFIDNLTGWAGTFSDQVDATVGGIYKYSGLATSLKPLAEIAKVDLMPNPSNGLVNFTLPVAKSGLTIEVIDALGKVVYTEKTSSTTVGETKQLNLEALPKGIYTVSIKTTSEKSFAKIVLQ